MSSIRLIQGDAIEPQAAEPLRAPFQYFGGKRKVAPEVWVRFGNVKAYIEPFFGSGAVLLARPHPPQDEIVNDIDGFLTNLWRAIQADPAGVAQFADWPVNELDLHARQRWLLDQADFIERMNTDPDFFDVKIAGWWVWGQSASIGNNWMKAKGERAMPEVVNPRGVHAGRVLHIGRGLGVHSDAFQGLEQRFEKLSARLRRVRICCGDWKRIVGIDPSYWQGASGIFLDPPYGSAAGRHAGIYSSDDLDVAEAVRTWALEHGSDPRLRIAICGYEGEHEMPEDWEVLAWKAHGGYSGLGEGQGKENRHRERIWFSPHCLKPGKSAQPQDLFAEASG